MKVLVIGGTNFIGPPVVRHLTSMGHEVTVLYPFREMPSRPLDAPVDYEKILVERVVMASDLPGTIVRLPMVYGVNDPRHRLFGYLQRMDDNRPAIVLEESVAHWRGCYGYVENIGYAIALCVTNERAKNRVYHVADAVVLSEAERIAKIGEVVGWQGKVVVLPKDQMPSDWKLTVNTEQHWLVDSTPIRQELGYSEIIPPDEALKRSIEWQRNHPPQKPKEFVEPWLLDYTTEEAILTKLG
jgi:nucleoside-diphosphate-sugar epimerase